MPVTSRVSLLTRIGALACVCLSGIGCATGASRSGQMGGDWRWPGSGLLGITNRQPSFVDAGPMIESEPGLSQQPAAGQRADGKLRWRWPGMAYAPQSPVQESMPVTEQGAPDKVIAASNGLRWRWPGMSYSTPAGPEATSAVALTGPSLEDPSANSTSPTNGTVVSGQPMTSPGASGSRHPGAPARGLLGDLRWRWPATGYSAGASANEATEAMFDQPFAQPSKVVQAEPATQPVRQMTGGWSRRMPPAAPRQTSNVPVEQPVQRVSGMVIASTGPTATPPATPSAPAGHGANSPRRPVIASSFRAVQRPDTVVAEPNTIPLPFSTAPMVADLSGGASQPIASAGVLPATTARSMPMPPAAPTGPRLTPMPMVESPSPSTDTPMPTEDAPKPRSVPHGSSAVVTQPVPGIPVGGVPLAGHGHHGPVPKEFQKQTLPPYVIEPPDVLLIESTQKIADQPIRGQHLVRPDGTVGLGIYGSAYVTGMTLDQAREAIGAQLALRIKDFDIKNLNVDVLAYNSKVYYIITDGGGYGEQVYRVPVTGNETVLDALGQINGLPPVASKKNIWVARATPGGVVGPVGKHGKKFATYGDQPNILPVDWCGITQRGSAATNYQLMPGDRVYVKADPWIRADSFLAKRLSPVERVLGTTLLGATTVNAIRNNQNFGGGVGF